MSSQLIIALDYDNQTKAYQFIETLHPHRCILKVGLELFTGSGPAFIRSLVAKQFKVFLDLKFHDIPHTVEGACKAAADLGVWMLNVHALGGFTMMKQARKALENYGQTRPLLTAVTVLTSLQLTQLAEVGIKDTCLEKTVLRLAGLAKEAGLDGVVCAAKEVPAIKAHYGQSFLTVTPGIRLPSDALDDQARVYTPSEAAQLGSDYVVMGRSITNAAYPLTTIDQVLSLLQPTS